MRRAIVAAAIGMLLTAAPAWASEAEELAAREGISTALAERDLELQQQAPEIVKDVKAKLGASYGGVWFNNKTGYFMVDLPPGASKAAAEEATAIPEVTSATKFPLVKSTYAQLEGTEASLESSLAGYGYTQQAMVGIEPKTNRVRVLYASNLSKTAKAQIKALATTDGAVSSSTAAQTLKAEPDACSFPLCTAMQFAMRGGLQLSSTESPPGAGYFLCTSGFIVAEKAIDPNNYYVMTAGHCLQDGAWLPWTSGECSMSPVTYRVDPGAEVGLLNANACVTNGAPPFGSMRPAVQTWGDVQENGLETLYTPASRQPGHAYPGLFVCHTGRTSVRQCGVVQYANITTYVSYPSGVIGIQHTDWMCLLGLPGDSGGPTFFTGRNKSNIRETWAVGTGIFIAANGTACGGSAYEFSYALEAMGVTVSIK
jgi:hypothetical protein